MSINTVENVSIPLLFPYKWYSRFFWIPWSLGWCLFGIYTSVYAHINNTRPEVGEIVLLWMLLSLLIVIGFVFGRRMMIILQPVQILEDGIKGNLQGDGFEFCPKVNSSFIGWADISKFEAFSYPDMDSIKMGKKSGVRLISKSGDKIVIYEHINNYGELLSMVRSRLEGGK